MSQRIEYESKDWFFFFFEKINQIIELFLCLKELSPVKNLTQELFFSKTWLKELCQKKKSKNLTSFYMTQRIELFFCCDSKNWTSFLYDSKNWTCFFNMTQRIEYDSKDWTFFCFNMTQRIVSFFRWLELNAFFFSMWLQELKKILNVTQRVELFFWRDSKNWTSFFFLKKNETLRNETFSIWLKDWTFFLIWLKELNMTQRIEPLFW